MSEPQLPSPEEMQKKLAEILRTAFNNDKTAAPDAAVPSTPEQDGSFVNKSKPQTSPLAEFQYTPRQIKKHLDRFVIRQDEAKKVLSIAVCDHYHHAREVANDQVSQIAMEYTKQNVLLIGPTGVGKTYLVKHIADLIGVPFVKADATKFSETGYVGGDVDDLVRELVDRAGGDIALAELGIIFLDEIDKIAGSREQFGRDVSGRGVQTALLKLMEETEVSLKSPTDMQAQIQAVMEMQRGRNPRKETINTRHILFIVSGAFEGLERIIGRRHRQSHIGFSASPKSEISETSLLHAVTTRDLVEYGFEPEFIGRLPVRSICHPLEIEDLFSIMKYSEGSIIRQYERAFHAYGINVQFEDDAFHEIARLATQENTGARGLLTVLEKLLRDFKYELPESGIKSFTVNASFVKNASQHLADFLQTGSVEKTRAMEAAAIEFFQHFSEQYSVQLEPSQAALERLVRRAQSEEISVSELCEQLFKDYQFGLQLIQKGNPGANLVLPEDAIDNPEGYLSELVIQSYHTESPESGGKV